MNETHSCGRKYLKVFTSVQIDVVYKYMGPYFKIPTSSNLGSYSCRGGAMPLSCVSPGKDQMLLERRIVFSVALVARKREKKKRV